MVGRIISRGRTLQFKRALMPCCWIWSKAGVLRWLCLHDGRTLPLPLRYDRLRYRSDMSFSLQSSKLPFRKPF